jgi:hypothetical protein
MAPSARQPGPAHQDPKALLQSHLAVLQEAPRICEEVRRALEEEAVDTDRIAWLLRGVVLNLRDEPAGEVIAVGKFLESTGLALPADRQPRLLRALDDPSPFVRLFALSRLAPLIGPFAKFVAPLRRLMSRDELPLTRKLAIGALRRLGEDLAGGAVPELAEALRDPGELRGEALRVLEWLGQEAEEAVPALVSILSTEEDAGVLEKVAQALVSIDPACQKTLSHFQPVREASRREKILLAFAAGGPGARLFRRRVKALWRGAGVCEPEGHVTPDQTAAAVDRSRTLGHPEHTTAGSQPDGPQPPNWFYWHGQRYECQPTPHKLLAFLWGKNRVPVQKAVEHVWQQDDVTENQLKTAIHRVNEVLEKAKVPWHYGQKQGHIVRQS